MVHQMPSDYPIAFGFKRHTGQQVYFDLANGILLSRQALTQFVEQQHRKGYPCEQQHESWKTQIKFGKTWINHKTKTHTKISRCVP